MGYDFFFLLKKTSTVILNVLTYDTIASLIWILLCYNKIRFLTFSIIFLQFQIVGTSFNDGSIGTTLYRKCGHMNNNNNSIEFLMKKSA